MVLYHKGSEINWCGIIRSHFITGQIDPKSPLFTSWPDYASDPYYTIKWNSLFTGRYKSMWNRLKKVFADQTFAGKLFLLLIRSRFIENSSDYTFFLLWFQRSTKGRHFGDQPVIRLSLMGCFWKGENDYASGLIVLPSVKMTSDNPAPICFHAFIS